MPMPNDMPPIKQNKKWIISIILSVLALLLLPLASNFTLLLIIPLGLGMGAFLLAFHEFHGSKEWITALISSIVVLALTILTCAQCLFHSLRSSFHPSHYYFEYSTPFEEEDEWFSEFWY